MKILLDVDDVVLDLVGNLLKKYNIEYEDNLTKDKITDWYISNFCKCGGEVYKYFKDKSLYDDIEPIKNSLEGVKFLRLLGHRVIFCTHSSIEVAGKKFKTLVRLGYLTEDQQSDYVEAKDKSLFDPSMVMIDDKPDNIRNFKGTGIVFSQMWNLKEDLPIRVNDWKEICDLFRVMAKNKEKI
jgi:5'(3')-deoxyribonucleotidase